MESEKDREDFVDEEGNCDLLQKRKERKSASNITRRSDFVQRGQHGMHTWSRTPLAEPTEPRINSELWKTEKDVDVGSELNRFQAHTMPEV